MAARITLVLFLLLSNISFSQSGLPTLKSGPIFSFLLNGVETAGAIHRSDSIIAVTCSDGKTYGILSIEMSCGERFLRIPGNRFSKEMKEFLKKSKKGQQIFFLLKLRAPNKLQIAVTASFLLE